MRILFLLTQDLESPSGLGRYYPIGKELTRLGHQVQIAALHPNYDQLSMKYQNINGIDIHYVAPMHVMKSGNIKSYYPMHKLLWVTILGTLKLTQAALNSNAEIVHICKPHPMNSIAGIFIKIFKKCILYLDCDDNETYSNHFAGKWQQYILQFFEKTVPKVADRVTTNTLSTRDMLVSIGIPASKIHYLSNGVDRERFSKPNTKELTDLKEALGLNGKKVISFIGSLSLRTHPVDLLMKSFAQVSKDFPEVKLLIVGGGEDYDQLIALANDLKIRSTTVFTGRVDSADVVKYYAISTVTVDPVYDNDVARGRSPLKMFESWACGVPFITACVGDRCELLGSPPAGLICTPGDVQSLTQQIYQVLTHQELSEKLIQQGKQRVSEYYWDVLVKDLANDYSRIKAVEL